MPNYKIYYINMDRSKDRREFMENQFKNLNISFERISAIDGKKLDLNSKLKANSEQNMFAHFGKMNYGEIGCFQSFIKSYNIISNQKEDFALLLEDDALINRSFFNDFKAILNSITIDDYVDITGRKGFIKIYNDILISEFIVPPLRNTAQIIGKNAGNKFYNSFKEYYAPIDVLKQDLYKHKVKLYSTNNKYVSHNDYNISGSTIQNKEKSQIKKVIRELIRPFWQLLSLFIFKLKRFIFNLVFLKFKAISK